MIWAGDRGRAVLAKTELRLTSEHPTAVSPECPFLPFAGRGLSSKIAHGGWDPRTSLPWTGCVTAGLSRPQCFPLKMRLRVSPISWDRCGGTCKTGWWKPPVPVAVGLFKKMRPVCGWAKPPQVGCHTVPSFCSVSGPHGDDDKCAYLCPVLFQAARCTCLFCPQYLWEAGALVSPFCR